MGSLLYEWVPQRGLIAGARDPEAQVDQIREKGARMPDVVEKVVRVKAHNYPATRKSTKRKLTPGKIDPNAWAKKEYGDV